MAEQPTYTVTIDDRGYGELMRFVATSPYVVSYKPIRELQMWTYPLSWRIRHWFARRVRGYTFHRWLIESARPPRRRELL